MTETRTSGLFYCSPVMTICTQKLRKTIWYLLAGNHFFAKCFLIMVLKNDNLGFH